MSAPARSDADSQGRGLDQLFDHEGGLGSRPDAEVAASRAKLAALFGQSQRGAESSEPPSDDVAADDHPFLARRERRSEQVAEAPAWEPPVAEPVAAHERVERGGAPVDAAAEGAGEDSVVLADTGEMFALFGLDDSDRLDADDQSAMLDRAGVVAPDDRTEAFAGVGQPDDPADAPTAVIRPDEEEVPAPVRAISVLAPIASTEVLAEEDRTEVLEPVAPTEVFAPVASTAVPAPVGPVAVSADMSDTSAGSRMRTRRRGAFGWTKRVRWSVAASVVLLAAVVVGAIVFAQTFAANNQATQALAAATAELEAAESDATQSYGLMETAFAEYDDVVLGASAAAASAGPALASVAGMTDETALAAANAALAALIAQLDATTLAAPPEPYERGDVDMTDLDAIAAATEIASSHAEQIATSTREARAAQAAIIEKMTALTAAQVALGSSLPGTAVIIVGENPRALQSFRDAVIAASVAVSAAQAAGASGDAELLAYAAAVTALRENQAERTPGPVTPRDTNPAPVPAPDPVRPADPVPTSPPEPTPEPTETTDPDVDEDADGPAP